MCVGIEKEVKKASMTVFGSVKRRRDWGEEAGRQGGAEAKGRTGKDGDIRGNAYSTFAKERFNWMMQVMGEHFTVHEVRGGYGRLCLTFWVGVRFTKAGREAFLRY